eukprot:evm.model.scf_274.9 EVM.evm.TU.scf_274.9   scf_274:67867-68637(-)
MALSAQAATAPKPPSPFRPTKPTLLDFPISNHGGRVRYLLYSKGLEGEVDVQSPSAVGGLKSEGYKAMHPAGKSPLLVLPDGLAIAESAAISNYILDKYPQGPSFRASSPEARARANAVIGVHDNYVSPTQACMYRAMDVEERAEKMRFLSELMGYFERMMVSPHVCGEEKTLADAALFPTFVFFGFILPSVFGWEGVFKGRPRLAGWWEVMRGDEHARRVMGEIEGQLEGWREKGRWRDTGIEEQVAQGGHKWAY